MTKNAQLKNLKKISNFANPGPSNRENIEQFTNDIVKNQKIRLN